MKNKICITDDLADVFMIQALKEGYCDYLIQKSQKQRNDFADYMLQDRKYTNAMYQEKFDRLSQLIRKRQTIRLTLKYTPLDYERRGFLHSSGRLSDHGIK